MLTRRFFAAATAMLAFACLGGISRSATSQAAELVMFESTICEWCDAWHEEVGVVYHKTPEGKRAPLRRVDVHDPHPADLSHVRSGRFTPTFVLMSEGQEIGRIRGYPGEDFFWGLLKEMLSELPAEETNAVKTTNR